MTVRIGLLRMDRLSVPEPEGDGDYPALFERMFDGLGVELVDVPVFLGDAPASLSDCDGWVVSGSRYSVYDDHDWIGTAEEILRDAVAAERPLVGICFGHQLLAQALGGKVERAEVGWRIGVQEYETTEPLPWLNGTRAYTLIASHQDQVVEPPADATVWSRGDAVPIAGMRVGPRAWSVQGHPEFTPGVAETIYRSRVEKFGTEAVEAAVESLARPLDNRRIAEAIVDTIRGR